VQRKSNDFSLASFWHLADMPLREPPPSPHEPSEEVQEVIMAAEFVPMLPDSWADSGQYLLAMLVHRVGVVERTDVTTVILSLEQPHKTFKERHMVVVDPDSDPDILLSTVDALIGPWVLLCAPQPNATCSAAA
jgi:hypothetical protein